MEKIDIDKLAQSLSLVERKVLPAIRKDISVEDIVEKTGLMEIEVMRALQWLENKALVKVFSEEREIVRLESNGMAYKESGFPERRFLKAIIGNAMPVSAIGGISGLRSDEINISIGMLKKKEAINITKENELIISITDVGKSLLKSKSDEEKFIENEFPLAVTESNRHVVEELLKRKQIIRKDKKNVRTINLTDLGKDVLRSGMSSGDVIESLSPRILKSGSWRGKQFRRYDVEINVPATYGGRRHFENQVVEYIKSIWLELGFKEMTGRMVQTSFWDLDALFVPQDHPARDMQDTFYFESPKEGKLPDKELVERVRKTHEDGWTTGSRGWQDTWSEDKSRQNLLRTHTTVLSARTIAQLKKEELPAKFFSVGKCFRNETLDWKHLFEFYQVEGIVVDPDANFSNLVGYLKEFFLKMGFTDVRIRPGHFPYTEPSAEVEVYHPVRKQWIELGGSGIFRPEVVKPLLGEAVPVLAWGLGLGRMISEYWDIKDIRDLNRNDIKQLRELRAWLK